MGLLMQKWDPREDTDLTNAEENKRHFAYHLRNFSAIHSSTLLWKLMTGAKRSPHQNRFSFIMKPFTTSYEQVKDYSEQTAESNEGEELESTKRTFKWQLHENGQPLYWSKQGNASVEARTLDYAYAGFFALGMLHTW